MRALWSLVERGREFAVYKGEIAVRGKGAVSLLLRFSLDRESLLISFEGVREKEGFDLLEVFLGEIVSMPEVRGGTLLLPTDCGREVKAERAWPAGREFGLTWFDPFLCAALYREGKCSCSLRPWGSRTEFSAGLRLPFEDLGGAPCSERGSSTG